MADSPRTFVSRRTPRLWVALALVPVAIAVVALLTGVTSVLAEDTETPEATEGASTAEGTEEGGLRIGFFDFSGYQDEDADGHRSGYSYDFLQKLQSYLSESFQYLDFDVSFSDSLDLLEAGDLDLLATITKTPEREATFLFSDEPMGTEVTNLTTKAGNDAIVPGDYATYDGMVVGVLDGNSANDDFAAFAEEKGFTYEPFTFETEEELIDALNEGIVDTILVSSIRTMDDEWLVESFEPVDLYVVVNRDNPELMARVNESMKKMDAADPNWRDELQAKFKTIGSTVSLDADERAYLKSLAEEGRTLTVLTSPSHVPYSTYTETDQPDGIFPALFDVVAAKVDLPCTYLVPADDTEYEQMIQDGTADIVIDVPDEPELAKLLGLKLTDPYVTADFAQVTRRDFTGMPETIAVVQGDSEELVDYLDETYPPDAVRYYPDGDSAVQAVLSGEADAIVAHLRSAEWFVLDDPRARLVYTFLDIPSEQYAIGVKESEPQELVDLLNEGIGSIDSFSYGSLIAAEVTPDERPMSLLIYLSAHPVLAGVFVVALQAAACVIVFFVTRAHYRRRLRGDGSGGDGGGGSGGDGGGASTPKGP